MPEAGEKTFETISKTQASYGSILLEAISNARRELARNGNVGGALDALICVLTPEVIETIRPDLEKMEVEYNNKRVWLQNNCIAWARRRKVAELDANFDKIALNTIIRALDDHGLLREMRSFEVGGRV